MIVAATLGAEAVLLALLLLVSRRTPSMRGVALAVFLSLLYSTVYGTVAAHRLGQATHPYVGSTRVLLHAFQGLYLFSIAAVLAATLSLSGFTVRRAWSLAGGCAVATLALMVATLGHARSGLVYPFYIAAVHGFGLTMLGRYVLRHKDAWSGPDGVARIATGALAATPLVGLLIPLIPMHQSLARFALFLGSDVALIAMLSVALARVRVPFASRYALVTRDGTPWRGLSPLMSTSSGFTHAPPPDVSEIALDFPDVHTVFRNRNPAAWDDFATRVAPRHPAFAQALDDVYFHVRTLPPDRAQALLRGAWEAWVRRPAPPEGAALIAVAVSATNVQIALRVFDAVGQLPPSDALMVLQMAWMMLGESRSDADPTAN